MWGPWSPSLTDPAERKAQLRCLAAIVYMLRQQGGADIMPLVRALREAEMPQCERDVANLCNDDPADDFPRLDDDLDRARRLFDLLPALHRRRIIATFAQVTGPRKDDIKSVDQTV